MNKMAHWKLALLLAVAAVSVVAVGENLHVKDNERIVFGTDGDMALRYSPDDGRLEIVECVGVESAAYWFDESLGYSSNTGTLTTFTADDTTPSVANGSGVYKIPATWTTSHDITAFDDGYTTQRIVVLGGDSDCNVVDGGTLSHLTGNWSGADGAVLELLFDGTNWWPITE